MNRAPDPVSERIRAAVSRRPVPWLAAAALMASLALLAVGLVLGPLVAAAFGLLAIAGPLLFRYPLVCLALPIVVAPIGLRELPFGGLQVIHLSTLAAIGGVMAAAATGRVRSRPPVTMAFGLLFVATMFAAAVVATSPLAGMRVGANYLFGCCLAIAAAAVVRDSAQGIVWLLRGWALSAAILIVPALPSVVTVSDQFSGSLVQGRVQGAFNQPNDFGEFSMMGAMASSALLVCSRTRFDRVVGGVGLGMGIAGIAGSFSRGTWIGALAMLLTIAVLSPRLRGWVVGLVALLPISLYVGAAFGAAPFPQLLARLFSLLTGSANPADDRPILYEHAWQLFLSHPVLGIGPGGFLASNYGAGSELIRRTYLHGHSVVLTVAAEVGLVGVIALLSFTVALAVSTLTARARLLAVGESATNARLAVLAGGLVGIAVHGLFDVVYTNPLLIPLAWLLAGIVAGETARIRDRLPVLSASGQSIGVAAR